jgi:hypothetical protein
MAFAPSAGTALGKHNDYVSVVTGHGIVNGSRHVREKRVNQNTLFYAVKRAARKNPSLKMRIRIRRDKALNSLKKMLYG